MTCSATEKPCSAADIGIFYFLDYGGIDNQLGEQPPFGGSNDYLATNGYCVTFTGQLPTVSAADIRRRLQLQRLHRPATVATDSGDTGIPLPARGYPNFNPANPPAGTSMIAVNPNNENSTVQEWNLQVEHQFGTNNVLNIAYVGTHGSQPVDLLPV